MNEWCMKYVYQCVTCVTCLLCFNPDEYQEYQVSLQPLRTF